MFVLITVLWHFLHCADEDDPSIHTLLVNSLFAEDNVSLAKEELPRIFPQHLYAHLRTSDETAAYAFALKHHPSLESLTLMLYTADESINMQPLLDALSHHPTARELSVDYIDIAAKGECGEHLSREEHESLCIVIQDTGYRDTGFLF